jgi:hypothetical protein
VVVEKNTQKADRFFNNRFMRNPIDFNNFQANPLKVFLSSIYYDLNFAETESSQPILYSGY